MARYLLDPTKPVQLRNGLPARLLATNLDNPDYPFAVAYRTDRGFEEVGRCSRGGQQLLSSMECDFDVINVPDESAPL